MFIYVFPSSRPPREKDLIENFNAHRAGFERLRDMLLEDKTVLAVATWGIETTTTGPHHVQPGEEFSLNRYNKYLALLEQIGGTRVYRIRGRVPELIGVSVWATGWGGDTRHIDICWTEQEPANEVANLDDYYRNPRRPRRVFRRIDRAWYIFADW